MLNGYYPVNIRFLDEHNPTRTYVYACYEQSIDVGNLVVVNTGHHGLRLARVAEPTDDLADAKVGHGLEIVAVVDTRAYDERRAKAAQLKELKTQMDAKVQELQATALYELMAEKDPALKDMLDIYKALIG